MGTRVLETLPMNRLYRVHLWFGCFSAPMLILFALTGGLQALDLHHSKKDGSYKAPRAIAWLSDLHQNKFFRASRQPARDCSAITDSIESQKCLADNEKLAASLRWKRWIFTALIVLSASSLLVNAITGLWMGFQKKSFRRITLILMALGTVIPILIILS